MSGPFLLDLRGWGGSATVSRREAGTSNSEGAGREGVRLDFFLKPPVDKAASFFGEMDVDAVRGLSEATSGSAEELSLGGSAKFETGAGDGGRNSVVVVLLGFFFAEDLLAGSLVCVTFALFLFGGSTDASSAFLRLLGVFLFGVG